MDGSDVFRVEMVNIAIDLLKTFLHNQVLIPKSRHKSPMLVIGYWIQTLSFENQELIPSMISSFSDEGVKWVIPSKRNGVGTSHFSVFKFSVFDHGGQFL